jgi:hypothetical protein
VKIALLDRGIDVGPMQAALAANPWLWNEHSGRTKPADSPHRDVDDIWVRYAASGITGEPHESVWYPSAELLPVRDIVFSLMAMVDGERLGGVLITRIPAGKACRPHVDAGWHARYYEKYAVQIAAAPGQLFRFEDECLETLTGDIYTFDNSFSHWVTNETAHDRITMIVCIKTGGAPCLGVQQ